MNKKYLAIAKAIKATKEQALESLTGESLITAAWVMAAVVANTEKELGKNDPNFDFTKFEQACSIEDE